MSLFNASYFDATGPKRPASETSGERKQRPQKKPNNLVTRSLIENDGFNPSHLNEFLKKEQKLLRRSINIDDLCEKCSIAVASLASLDDPQADVESTKTMLRENHYTHENVLNALKNYSKTFRLALVAAKYVVRDKFMRKGAWSDDVGRELDTFVKKAVALPLEMRWGVEDISYDVEQLEQHPFVSIIKDVMEDSSTVILTDMERHMNLGYNAARQGINIVREDGSIDEQAAARVQMREEMPTIVYSDEDIKVFRDYVEQVEKTSVPTTARRFKGTGPPKPQGERKSQTPAGNFSADDDYTGGLYAFRSIPAIAAVLERFLIPTPYTQTCDVLIPGHGEQKDLNATFLADIEYQHAHDDQQSFLSQLLGTSDVTKEDLKNYFEMNVQGFDENQWPRVRDSLYREKIIKTDLSENTVGRILLNALKAWDGLIEKLKKIKEAHPNVGKATDMLKAEEARALQSISAVVSVVRGILTPAASARTAALVSSVLMMGGLKMATYALGGASLATAVALVGKLFGHFDAFKHIDDLWLLSQSRDLTIEDIMNISGKINIGFFLTPDYLYRMFSSTLMTCGIDYMLRRYSERPFGYIVGQQNGNLVQYWKRDKRWFKNKIAMSFTSSQDNPTDIFSIEEVDGGLKEVKKNLSNMTIDRLALGEKISHGKQNHVVIDRCGEIGRYGYGNGTPLLRGKAILLSSENVKSDYTMAWYRDQRFSKNKLLIVGVCCGAVAAVATTGPLLAAAGGAVTAVLPASVCAAGGTSGMLANLFSSLSITGSYVAGAAGVAGAAAGVAGYLKRSRADSEVDVDAWVLLYQNVNSPIPFQNTGPPKKRRIRQRRASTSNASRRKTNSSNAQRGVGDKALPPPSEHRGVGDEALPPPSESKNTTYTPPELQTTQRIIIWNIVTGQIIDSDDVFFKRPKVPSRDINGWDEYKLEAELQKIIDENSARKKQNAERRRNARFGQGTVKAARNQTEAELRKNMHPQTLESILQLKEELRTSDTNELQEKIRKAQRVFQKMGDPPKIDGDTLTYNGKMFRRVENAYVKVYV